MKRSLILAAVVIVSAVTIFSACNKLSKATYMPVTDTIAVKSSVVVIDPDRYHLISSANELSRGEYVYTFEASLPDLRHNGELMEGNVIVGTTDEGYMRKIISVKAEAEKITVYTAQAKLEDIVLQGNISFQTQDFLDAEGRNSLVSIPAIDLEGRTLYSRAGTVIHLNSGHFSRLTNWKYDFKYLAGQLSQYTSSCTVGITNSSADVSVYSASDAAVDVRDSIFVRSSYLTLHLGNVPLKLKTEVYFTFAAKGEISTNSSCHLVAASSDSFEISSSYISDKWFSGNIIRSGGTISGTPISGVGNSNLKIEMGLQTIVSICGTVASRTELPMRLDLVRNISALGNDFSVSKTAVAISNEKTYLYSYTPLEFLNETSGPSANYVTPYSIAKVSGDRQSGSSGQYLPSPIVVAVSNNNGGAAQNAKVTFKVISGGGSVSISSVTTNSSGIAQTNWLIGSGSPQVLEASVTDASGNALRNSPVRFTAN